VKKGETSGAPSVVHFQSIGYVKERSLILTRSQANEWRSLNNAGNLT